MLTPPALAERMLRATVRDAEWRESITGDLREEFATVAAHRGQVRARRWYWQQALPLAARFATSHVLPWVAPARRRVTVADIEHAGAFGAGWTSELRHAARGLWQRPGLTAVMVLTLAVTLAANAVIFNLADAMYLRPYRFPDVDRLVMIASDAYGDGPFIDRESVAPADFRDWTTALRTLNSLAAAEWWDPNLSGIDVPEQIPGFKVTPGFFELLGVSPHLGRTFSPADGEPENHRRVLLSHAFWTRQFASDPHVIGRAVRLDGEPYEVVGVMPPRFGIPHGANVWVPIALDEPGWRDRKNGRYMTFGRLTPGQSVATAQSELTAIVARQAAEFPETNRGREVTVQTFTRGLGDELVGPLTAIWQAAAVLLLLVGCANIANLLLARGTERQPEFAVRLALGAGRLRLCAQLFIEGLVVALLGVGLAAALTAMATGYSRSYLPANIIRFVPGIDYIRLDGATTAVLFAFGGLATIVFSLLPAVNVTRSTVGASALGAARVATAGLGRQWGRSLLMGVQVAFTLALIVGAALIVTAVDSVTNRALGFDKVGLLTARLSLPERKYADEERRRQFATTVLDRVREVASVTDAALVSSLPFSGSNADRALTTEGQPLGEPRPNAIYQRVSPTYFQVMRIPLVSGRAFDDRDRQDASPVAIVSRTLAANYFSGEDAVGKRLRVGDDTTWLTIVGVVGDVAQDPINATRAALYRPWAQTPTSTFSIAARTTASPLAVARDLQQAVVAVDPDQPVSQLMSMDALNAERLSGLDYFAKLLMVMSAIGLVLALTGTYSLVTYLTARRTRELSVRMALGATEGQVTWLGTSGAARIAIGGVVLGSVLATLVGRTMQSALAGFVSTSAPTVAAAALLVAALTLWAAYVPARRAARLDPWQAMRVE